MGQTGMTQMLSARCRGWLGAPATYGMALPEAKPTASQMYCPRGVYIDSRFILVNDSGNHRLLGWKIDKGLPARHSEADFVVGQPDFLSEGAKLLHLPTGLTMVDQILLIADAWHHRVLGWYSLPQNGEEPDFIIGQKDMQSTEPNRGRPGNRPGADSLYWPYGLAYIDGYLYVADTGNRRVLFWKGIPKTGEAAHGIIGQDRFENNEENRGAIGPASFRWAHDIAGSNRLLLVADAGNHRILGFATGSSTSGAVTTKEPFSQAPASLLLGQKEFDQTEEYPYRPQSASSLRFPYGLSYLPAGNGEKALLAVADTANNRVLIFEDLPDKGRYLQARTVIGQPDFAANGENNWKAVTEDSLCWPYGLHLHRFDDGTRILAVADSGNNRIMLWQI